MHAVPLPRRFFVTDSLLHLRVPRRISSLGLARARAHACSHACTCHVLAHALECLRREHFTWYSIGIRSSPDSYIALTGLSNRRETRPKSAPRSSRNSITTRMAYPDEDISGKRHGVRKLRLRIAGPMYLLCNKYT